MSYILEALKKSDQQRQRGATPTLQVAQVTVAVPKRPLFIYYGLLAMVLLVTGIMIGWLRPWQPEHTYPDAEAIAAESPVSIRQQTALAPLAAPSEMLGKTAQEIAAPNPTTAGTPSAAEPVSDEPARLAGDAQKQEAILLNELPLQIQQEIPAMAVQLHAYSSVPSERLVSINSIRLREGESLMLGLRLEHITPDGMIFSYKGYRFKHGIR